MYTIVDEDTDLVISHESATRLLDKIDATGRVCAQDVLTLECESGSVPARIANSCSSTPSSIGISGIKSLLRKSKAAHVDRDAEAGDYAIMVMRGMLVDGTVDAMIKILEDTRDAVRLIYIPGLTREKLALAHTSLSKVPVQLLCGNSPVWESVDISHLHWLRDALRANNTIGTILLPRIANAVTESYYQCGDGSYPGTLEEFLYTLTSMLGAIEGGLDRMSGLVNAVDEREYRTLVVGEENTDFWCPGSGLNDRYIGDLIETVRGKK